MQEEIVNKFTKYSFEHLGTDERLKTVDLFFDSPIWGFYLRVHYDLMRFDFTMFSNPVSSFIIHDHYFDSVDDLESTLLKNQIFQEYILKI